MEDFTIDHPASNSLWIGLFSVPLSGSLDLGTGRSVQGTLREQFSNLQTKAQNVFSIEG